MSHAQVSLLYGVLAGLGTVAGGVMLDEKLAPALRGLMPVAVVAMAFSLAIGTEMWCSRRELAPPGAVEHSPKEHRG